MAIRKKPKIGTIKYLEESPEPNKGSMSCIVIPLGIVIGYFITSAFVHVIFNSATKFEKIIIKGTLICLLIIIILGIRSFYQDWKVMDLEKKKWIEACTIDQVKIVGRSGGTWDDGYRYHTSWWLKLEMNSDQIAIYPNENIVSVKVSQHIYKRLEKCNSVRIYYLPKTPLEFLLEDEL